MDKKIIINKEVRYCPYVRNQGKKPSCVAESLSQILEFCYTIKNKDVKKFSSGSIYAHPNYRSKRNTKGMNTHMITSYMCNMGGAIQELINEDGIEHDEIIKNFNEQYNDTIKENMLKHTLLGNIFIDGMGDTYDQEMIFNSFNYPDFFTPPIISITVYPSFYNGRHNPILENINDNEEAGGGHSMIIVGDATIDNKEYWIVQNSWGESWGYNGKCFMPKDYKAIKMIILPYYNIKHFGDTTKKYTSNIDTAKCIHSVLKNNSLLKEESFTSTINIKNEIVLNKIKIPINTDKNPGINTPIIKITKDGKTLLEKEMTKNDYFVDVDTRNIFNQLGEYEISIENSNNLIFLPQDQFVYLTEDLSYDIKKVTNKDKNLFFQNWEGSNLKELNIDIIEKINGELFIKNPKTTIEQVKGLDNNYSDKDKKQVWINQGSISSPSKIDNRSTTHTRQINVSKESSISCMRSQINASSECNISNALNSQINSSWKSNNNIERGQINASLRCHLTKDEDRTITDSLISSSADSGMHNSNKSSMFSSRHSNIDEGFGVSSLSSHMAKSNDGSYSSLLSSNLSENNSNYSSIISSRSSNIDKKTDRDTIIYYSSVLASEFGKINGSKSAIIASDGGSDRSGSCMIDKWNSVILASRNVVNPTEFTICGGLGETAIDEETGEGMGSAENRKWEINSLSGEIKASGSITGNSSFADFAEYMESSDGKAIPLGTIVALDEGQKIRVAQPNDNPIGIISGTAGIVLNAQGFEWKDKYLYDRYGQPILVDKEVEDGEKINEMYDEYLLSLEENVSEDEIGKTDNIAESDIMTLEEFKDSLDTIPMTTIKAPRLNPKYDPKAEYISRKDRDEWNVVGMKGQIYVNIDDTVEEGGYITVGKDGIGTDGIIEVGYKGVKAHKLWQVMEITTPYNKNLGYGIARVII